MIQVSIPEKEQRAFRNWLNRQTRENTEKCKNLVASKTELLVRTSKDRARNVMRVRTGRLRASIVASYTLDKLGSRTDVNVNYAAAMEFGSRPHRIRARNKPYLWFPTSDGWVRTKEVNHPGTKPRPFFFNTFEQVKKQYISELNKMGFR